MSTLSEHHRPKAGIVGKCSVPMWMNGCPAGFCDDPAYGQQYDRFSRHAPGSWSRERFPGPHGIHPPYCSALCCKGHGGPGENDIRFMRDGNMWMAFNPDFENLAESIAGFGTTQDEAEDDLLSALASAAGGRSPETTSAQPEGRQSGGEAATPNLSQEGQPDDPSHG